MKISVLYFAAVRDLVGVAGEAIEVGPAITTVGALSEELVRRHPALEGRLAPVRFAKNEAFTTLAEPIADGDVIALIPPVAGG